jgi:hypothetical protein
VTRDDGDPADPGGFLTGERLCILRAWANALPNAEETRAAMEAVYG